MPARLAVVDIDEMLVTPLGVCQPCPPMLVHALLLVRPGWELADGSDSQMFVHEVQQVKMPVKRPPEKEVDEEPKKKQKVSNAPIKRGGWMNKFDHLSQLVATDDWTAAQSYAQELLSQGGGSWYKWSVMLIAHIVSDNKSEAKALVESMQAPHAASSSGRAA